MSEAVKLTVFYYSATGTNYKMAQAAAKAAEDAGAEVRLRKIAEIAPQNVINGNAAWAKHLQETRDVPEATLADVEWADALIFSSPTRFGGAASAVRAFIDSMGGLWAQGKLVNKIVSVMSSAQNPHGGQETTSLTLYITFMHWGAILVPPGYTDASIFAAGGNPYGSSVTATGEGAPTEAELAAIKHQAARVVEVTGKFLN